MKFNLRSFFIGFLLSVIFTILMLGLAFVNYHAYQTGTPDYAPIVSLEEAQSVYTISIVGKEIYFDQGLVQDMEPTLQKLSVFLPTDLRMLAAGYRSLGEAVREYLPHLWWKS
ncbi:hypothetical protein [Harryflintia acetispora]|uniref:hypothetical protein n=1 Tax=Harryflintia acetispora TaxID=1849041 RepID=UPI001897BF7C|nr:hypothetical protein [Harryflintia acetispora]